MSGNPFASAIRNLNKNVKLADLAATVQEREQHVARIASMAREIIRAASAEKASSYLVAAEKVCAPSERDTLPVFACVRGDQALLPRWYEHYHALGFGPFFIIDDDSPEPISALLTGPDVNIFRPIAGNYRACKVVWIEALLKTYVVPGSWVLTVDADEFLDFPAPPREIIKKLSRWRDRSAVAILVDMLPDPECAVMEEIASGRSPIDLFTYCLNDPMPAPPAYVEHPCVQWGFGQHWQKSYRIDVRYRLFGSFDSLRKVPLFQYEHEIKLHQGFHDIVRPGAAPTSATDIWSDPILPMRHYKIAKLFDERSRLIMLENVNKHAYFPRTSNNICAMVSQHSDVLENLGDLKLENYNKYSFVENFVHPWVRKSKSAGWHLRWHLRSQMRIQARSISNRCSAGYCDTKRRVRRIAAGGVTSFRKMRIWQTARSKRLMQQPTVLIFRRDLLPFSETFIKRQVQSLTRWRGILLGTPMYGGLPLDSLERLSIKLPSRNTILSATLPGKRGRHSAETTPFQCALAVAEHIRSEPWFGSLRKMRPRIVHAHFGTNAEEVWPLAIALRVPFVVTLHGYDVSTFPECWRERPGYKNYPEALRDMARHGVKFLSVSDALTALAAQYGIGGSLIRKILIGVDTKQIRVGPTPIDARSRRILFVGRFVEKKGAAHLIRAFKAVRQLVPDAELRIIGTGPLEQELLELSAETEGIEFTGKLGADAVFEEMHSARVLCVPSIRAANGDAEGMPTVIAEAQAAGLPVVTSAPGGIEEGILDGVSGIGVAEKDHDGLVGALVRVLIDDAFAVSASKAARVFAAQQLEISLHTQLLEAYYDELATSAPEFLPAHYRLYRSVRYARVKHLLGTGPIPIGATEG